MVLIDMVAQLGGLCTAAELREAGFTDLVILEKSSDLGGVWHANRYPNVACDTPIDMYSIRCFPGGKWSTNFAPGQKIWSYVK